MISSKSEFMQKAEQYASENFTSTTKSIEQSAFFEGLKFSNDNYKANNLLFKIKQWGLDKNIIQEAPKIKQAEKTLEECGELIIAVATDNKEEIADAIGDIVVTLVLQAEMQGLSFIECIQGAYDTIKDRKGKLINGKFVKEQ